MQSKPIILATTSQAATVLPHSEDQPSANTTEQNQAPISDPTSPKASRAMCFAARTLSVIPPETDCAILNAVKLIAGKWAEQNGIISGLLPNINFDDHNLLPSIAGAAYSGIDDTYYLNRTFIDQEMLRRLSPHELTHAIHTKWRTRLKLQHPTIYTNTAKDHIKDLTLNGEHGAILYNIETCKVEKEGKTIRLPKSCEFRDAPYLPQELRKELATVLDLLFKNHDEIFTTTDPDYRPRLSKKEKKILATLLDTDTAADFISQYKYHENLSDEENYTLAKKEACSKLVKYMEAQLFRTLLLHQNATVTDENVLRAISFPMSEANTIMSQDEIEKSVASLQGYLSTLEGNLRVQYPAKDTLFATPSPEEVMSYCLGAYEEREAERSAARFMTSELKEEMSSPSNAGNETKLRKISERISSQDANIRFLKLADDYAELKTQIGALPQNIETLREIHLVKDQLKRCRTKLQEVDSLQNRLIVEREPKEKTVNADGSVTYSRVLGEDESALFCQTEGLRKQIAKHEKTIIEKSKPENLFDFSQIKDEENPLIKQKKLLEMMKTLIPETDFIITLPQNLFNSNQDWQDYQKSRLGEERVREIGKRLLGSVVHKELEKSKNNGGIQKLKTE